MSAEEHDPENWEGAPETFANDPREVAAQVARSAFWKSLESTEAEASAFADRLCSAARRHESRATAWRWWRGTIRTSRSMSCCTTPRRRREPSETSYLCSG